MPVSLKLKHEPRSRSQAMDPTPSTRYINDSLAVDFAQMELSKPTRANTGSPLLWASPETATNSLYINYINASFSAHRSRHPRAGHAQTEAHADAREMGAITSGNRSRNSLVAATIGKVGQLPWCTGSTCSHRSGTTP